MELKNGWRSYGFDIARELQEQDGTEYQFGAFSQVGIADIPLDNREAYLPQGEVQRGKEDMWDCASRGPLNILAAKFTCGYKNKLFRPENNQWLWENGYVVDGKIDFSDAF